MWCRVDTIEAALLKAGLPRSFATGLAAYVGARDIAQTHLELGRTVVIDAVNGVREARSMWRRLARRTHARRFVVELVVPDAREHRRRVERRRPPTPPLPKPTWSEVESREYVEWREPILRVDGTRPVRESLERVRRHVGVPRRRTGPPRRS